jgi:dienelactone hydrolase
MNGAWFAALALAVTAPPASGTVPFTPAGDLASIPLPYRLEAHHFPFTAMPRLQLPHSGVTTYQIQFPSAVISPHEVNNTVHAELFMPAGPGPFPAVVVLDILAGDQRVSRLVALYLAQHRVAALTLHMAYYGPRRPPGSKLRLLSPNVPHTIEAVRQSVLDVRRATALLGSLPQVQSERLGIVGVSLGSFLAALTAASEPRLTTVALALGGGGLVDAYYDDPRALTARRAYELLGGSKEAFKKIIAPVDPLTYAPQLRTRKLLLIAAERDDVVPPVCARTLWEATNQPKLVWVNATHVGAAVYLLPMLDELTRHFEVQR